jgi:hypothetical protein
MISTYASSGESDPHLFRTLFDGWHAYRHGGHLLNRNGRPQWANSVKLKDHRKLGPLLRSLNFISKEASAILARQVEGVIVKDHGIPVSVVRDRIIAAVRAGSDDVRGLLIRNSWLGAISKVEHDRLNAEGMRASLPECPDDPMRRRYLDVGILECTSGLRETFIPHSQYPHLLTPEAR